MASSQNGWPASADAKSIGVESFLVPGTDLKLRVAKKVAPVLINFAAEFNELVEKLEGKQLDDWGYAYRQVAGLQTCSATMQAGLLLISMPPNIR